MEGVERRGSGSRSGSEIRHKTESKTKKLRREPLKWAVLVAKVQVHEDRERKRKGDRGRKRGRERVRQKKKEEERRLGDLVKAEERGSRAARGWMEARYKEDVERWLSGGYYRMRISHRVR